MSADGAFLCFTLEDSVRKEGIKIHGKTAIPEGRYKCAIEYSEKFKALMVRVLNVPDFAGILVHRLNLPTETEGCIGVGTTPGIDTILDSTLAYAKFCQKVSEAIAKKEDIWMEIRNVRERLDSRAVA